MESRAFGRTGFKVSPLALGTVALGTSYGFSSGGGSLQPSESNAIDLIRLAAERGITLFDTAPTYGTAERIVGTAIGSNPRCVVATKVTIPSGVAGKEMRLALLASLESSRKAIRRDVLDIVQIHNATPEVLARPDVVDTLRDARASGLITSLGASVYSASEAMASIDTGWVDVLQVPFNVLDQRIVPDVLDRAALEGVAILTRSALLKGALTQRVTSLPAPLEGLRVGVDRARRAFGATWETLPEFALRFCLSEPRVASVLVGASSERELHQAIAAAEAGPLAVETAADMTGLSLGDERLIDPRHWPAA